jgi:glycosyltransferase involved in cell wall biosynthesis
MASLNPLLLNYSDSGGAGNATRRIHEGLEAIGVDSKMLVRKKSSDSMTVLGPETKFTKVFAHIRPFLDSLPLSFYDAASEYSLSWLPDNLGSRINVVDPDVVHLNWVAGGFMSPERISSINRPIIWRLPDMWPMTGGCHYTNGCTKYQESCGACPKLRSTNELDPSRITLKRKRRAVAKSDITVVATTPWLADHARSSAIFNDCPVTVIPNGLDTEIYKPIDKCVGRELFNLPTEPPLVLFGSVGPLSNERKGYDLLRDSLQRLSAEFDTDAELVVFGTQRPDPDPDPEFGLPTHYTGYINDDESLSLLYSAADVMVVPSRYEGFGQTVTEAMACGTPVAAFDGSGPGDTILHEETGYLAAAHETDDLAAGIDWLLAETASGTHLGTRARERAVKKYHYTTVAKQYLELYESMVSNKE